MLAFIVSAAVWQTVWIKGLAERKVIMNWSLFHAVTLGISFGTFGFLYLIVVIKGIPEAIKTMRSEDDASKR